MAYATSPFGNGVLVGSGGNVTSNVHNHYGIRDSGKVNGVLNTAGAMKEMVIHLDAAMVTAEAFPLMAPVLPAGVRIEDVYLYTTEAFVLGGTTPVVEIGTEGSEATNGFTIAETNLENVGMYDMTSALSGTWSTAVGLVANTIVGIDLAGTSPTNGTAGRAVIVIRYVDVAPNA